MTTYSVRTVDGQEFVWKGELRTAHANDVSTDIPAGKWLICPSGTLINMTHVVSMSPLG